MRNLVAWALVLSACNRGAPSQPAPRDVPAPTAARDVPVVRDVPPADAGPPAVLVVRVRNVGPTPLRILTNPDANEMIHIVHLSVSPSASDRAAMFGDGPRVKFFAVGQMALCGSDAGGGYGGLGQPGQATLAPDESIEIARWDGILREEILDPAQGVCQRRSPAPAGRYRLQFDQPQLHGGPVCTRALVTVPSVGDGGVPVAELRCRAFVPDGGV